MPKMINPKDFNVHNFTPVKATVAAVIEKNGKIFLTKRSPVMKKEGNKWCLPGGHIDIGETAEEAIKREVKEETRFDLRNVKFLGYQDEYIPRIKTRAVNLILSGKPSGKNHLSNEVSEEKWFSKKQLGSINIAFKHKEVINKFAKKLK
ncbi:MAG: NUDIX hydrolase [Nanoarchaeota archaeon]